MTNVILSAGKVNNLKCSFYGGGASPIRYMALGVGTGTPTEASTGLGSECNSGTHLGYARVELSNVFTDASKKVESSATFDTSNITNSTTLKEIGLVTASSSGTFWCICQIPDTVKSSSNSLTFKITTTVV